MRRWLLLLPLFVLALFIALQADAAVKDTNASANIAVKNGQYELTVANTGDVVITSFTFVAAPTLHVSSIVSSTMGSCQVDGSGFSCGNLIAQPPMCPCTAGDEVHVLFTGSGEAGGSKVQIGGTTIAVEGNGSVAAPTTTTTTPTTTPATPPVTQPTPTAKPKAKAVPKCKKGQKSTKKRPCRK